MNTDPECNCCPLEICCLSQCSSRPHISFKNRAERPLKYEADCGTKNCNTFGGHDTVPMPERQCHQKLLKIKNENKNSLGSPIGLVTSNANFKTEGKTSDVIKTRYATYLKAFASLYLKDEKEWDSQFLDDIMKEGLDLYTESQNKQSDDESPASDIYMSHEQEVLREFDLYGFTFHVELMPKFQLLVANSTESGAKGDGAECTLDDIMPALRSFMHQHKYGLLKIGTFYTMIWRSTDAYFVFDACGRRLTDFQADKENGVVMLMCFKSLQNVRHLFHNLSGLHATDPLVIRELKMVKIVTPQGNIMQQVYSLRNHQYEIVNDDYAYLRSDLHLTLNKADLLRNPSGLPVAVTAIVVSKIDHPATWDLKMVDKIICFGVNFCQALWMKCKSTEVIDINEFPTTFVLGQFRINIEIKSHFYQGMWYCVPAFKHTELANALQNAFNAKHHKLILQLNSQMYAIWKKQEFIYLLDPYRHRIMGKQNESKMYEQMEKSASVRMFRAFDVFMNVLNQILLDSNRTSHFCLHYIKVRNIQTLHKAKPGQVKQVTEPQRDEYGEILSLNESICFEEAEDLCTAALGEISDYEDDDLRSDVVEMELRTSSSEEDLLEEEVGAGEVGEMEDIESSSSGEEDGVYKKKTPGDKRFRKGSAAKRKEAKKGDGNKNKKGKAAKDTEHQNDEGDIKLSDRSKKPKKKYKEKNGGKIKQNEESDDEGSEDLKTKDDKSKQNKEPESHKFTKIPEKSATDKVQEKHINKQKTGKNDSNESKGIGKEKDASKEKGLLNKDKNENKDEKPGREIDANKHKELNKSADLNKTTDLAKYKEPGKDENKEKGPSKDEHNSKVKDKIIGEDKPLNQGKDNDLSKTPLEQKETINEDLNKSVHSESKPDLGKSKHDEKDTNKENERFQSSHKFLDNKDSAKDKGKAAEEQIDKLNDKFKKRTETPLIEKSHKEESDKIIDDEVENKETMEFCFAPKPNRYPGYLKYPVDMAVVGSESGSYQSICKLFQAGFKDADRLLLMVYWGNFVIFRCINRMDSLQKHYYLFDGCTCDFNRFRHFDLSVGTAGLICFEHIHNIIEYIRHLRRSRCNKKPLNNSADEICEEYGNKSFILRV